MDIVRMRCGLGNQMFCYALYLELLCRGREVGIDMGFYTKYPDWPDPYMLEHVFPRIQIDPVDESIFYSICEKYNKETVAPERKQYYEEHPEERILWGENKSDVGFYREDVFKTSNCAFVGEWYSEKYFEHAKSMVRESFVFREGEAKLLELAQVISSQNSVALHVRLGRAYSYVDMTTPNGRKVVNIAQDGYYSRAIERMKRIAGDDAVYYVFSDAVEVLSGNVDENQVASNFRTEGITIEPGADNYHRAVETIKSELAKLNVVYVRKEDFDTYEDWYDMYLMTKTKHNIIANSSFAWWGAWLNGNHDKTVIAPRRFFAYADGRDIYPEEWVRM